MNMKCVRMKVLLSVFLVLCITGQAHAQEALPTPAPSAEQVAREQRTLELETTRDHLHQKNRRYQVPVVGLALGGALLVTSALLLVFAEDTVHSNLVNNCCLGEPDESNLPMMRAGLGLLPISVALVLVSAPMLVVRVTRHVRFKRIERELAWLRSHASLRPLLKPREQLGLTASVRF